jgi:hypothetical protein
MMYDDGVEKMLEGSCDVEVDGVGRKSEGLKMRGRREEELSWGEQGNDLAFRGQNLLLMTPSAPSTNELKNKLWIESCAHALWGERKDEAIDIILLPSPANLPSLHWEPT